MTYRTNCAASEESVILDPPNPYGYRINISHPRIRPLYDRYREWRGIPKHFPLSDQERFEFEEYILDRNPHLRRALEAMKQEETSNEQNEN